MPPRVAVGLELARALGALAVLPLRVALHLAAGGRARREVAADLAVPREVEPGPALPPLPARPLRVFVSCAEPSGEIHGRSLVQALRRRCAELGAPEPTFSGLGSARLAGLGVELVGNPVERAAFGFHGIGRALPYYLGLLRDVREHLEAVRPDVVVPVDSPALHVPLGRLARGAGAPVVHFVTPQYWAWAPWRVGGYRRAVDLALTILPFEPAWFERHGVRTAHVGHPLLDALPAVDDAPAPGEGGPLVLLAGSRRGVLERNLPWMLETVAELRRRVGDLEVVLPHDREELRPVLEEALDRAGRPPRTRVAIGDLHGTLATARAAFCVSGTVLLDLLHHRVPAVVVYRVGSRMETWMYRRLLTVPWFSSPNLLAGREVYPEFCFRGEGPRAEVLADLERALADPAWRADCRAGLEEAAGRLGPPGAAERAADHALAVALGAGKKAAKP